MEVYGSIQKLPISLKIYEGKYIIEEKLDEILGY
jgi:hypothetical protein